MHKTPAEAEEFVLALKGHIGTEMREGVDVAVCPSFPALPAVARVLSGSGIFLGAQNMHWALAGAYTGEVSAPMLKELGCSYVILGHSERRLLFGETDEMIRRKLRTAIEYDLCPIYCLGERLIERGEGRAEEVCLSQLRSGLKGLPLKDPQDLVIAYEPVWAIGTRRTATPEDAVAIIKVLRKELSAMFGGSFGEGVRILYGGSVKPDNTVSFMEKEDIDGLLVGGASLDLESFVEIIRLSAAARRLKS
ncbi:MAG: Triosephosphate isomerase [Thermoanaerobacterales bacterium 50_218]|nr:MAG: Triosephosphate isomerase [Thermoanaerobacterales bacterium 50_218]HAA90039.1 triose-phosphate isomerase [Peptococcaceae bacterium]